MQYVMLSLLKDYRCSLCAQCCHDWNIEVTTAEIARIESGLVGFPATVVPEYGFDKYQDPDAADKTCYYFKMFANHCGFLQDDNKCFLHCRFGVNIKPAICVSYPLYAIVTPEITYFSSSFSCMSTAALLQKDWHPYVQELTKPLPGIYSLRENESQWVRLEANQMINWQTFYFLQSQLVSYPGRLPLLLDSLWQQIKAYPYQYLGVPELRKMLEKPLATSDSPQPLAHLQLMSRILCAMADYNFEPVLFLPQQHLFWQLGIDNYQPDSSGAWRYHRRFRENKLKQNRILINYLRSRIFISDWYFSRNIADSIALFSMTSGLASLFAIAAAGSGPCTDEDLLQGIFAVEKYFFHSDVANHIDLRDIRPKVAFSPL